MKGNFRRLRVRRETIRALNLLTDRPEQVLIVHYSCESFNEHASCASPRVTSIGVRYLANGQTHSFSIHYSAEKRHVAKADIPAHLDELEKDLLDGFYQLAQEHRAFTWVHWNMRDMQYGFASIEHRYRVLGGTPLIIPDNQKHDLARSLVAIYGTRYMNHPRFQNLMAANDISAIDFLTGEEEAKAFADGLYQKVHRSTLRKIDNMANVLERAASCTLVTRSTKRDVYGTGLLAALEWFQEHPAFVVLGILGGVASIIALTLQLMGK